jgi:hypothetical protein
MGFFDSLFGGNKSNPANSAMPYLNQIPGQTSPYFQPYINAGQNALPQLQEQYGNLLSDPGSVLNKIGGGYKESPGLDFAIQKALGASGRAAAAGGMAGSPAHQQNAMELATGLANQDYGNWMNNALGLYGGGLQGQQGMAGMGLQAGGSLADMIAQTLAQQGNLAFQGQSQQNQRTGDWMKLIGQGLGAAGSLGAFGPMGALGSLAMGGFGSSMFGGG